MSTGRTIRPAKPSEHAVLEELQTRASLAYEDYREALLANPDAIQIPLKQITDGLAFVCDQGNEILGFAVALPRDDGDFELDGLFVEPHLWRSGIGTALLHEAERRALLGGAAALHVVANPRAEGFYQVRGFEIRGRQQTRFGPAHLMAKALR